ncbi:MAG TPA: flagellar hook-associated protein FlgK [Tepidisphaeraceae bacterium]|jgi:flagellar hook-associated protein 1 FlgK|nr:flagellar hook-associated protein FlgK [Tepidisphaeraceae bacterium]
MSLLGALNTGATGLAVSQAAIQTTGNNISNAGNADYARETVQTSPALDQQIQQGIFVGTGVDLTSVQRQIDDALNARLRSSVSDSQSASTAQQWLGQVQSVFDALGTDDLQTSMNNFFNSWSTLANNPQDTGQRQIVLQNGQSLAQKFNSQVQQLDSLSSEVNDAVFSQAQSADNLASQVASLNSQIVVAQGGSGGTANSLQDQRDGVLKQLSQLMNITTVQQPSGAVDVYVGSEPLVSGSNSQGVTVQNQNVNGTIQQVVAFKANNEPIPLNGGGQLGALVDMQGRISGVVTQEDTLAHNLIFELNKVYSSGQGLQGFSSVTATNAVTNPAQPLSSAAAGLQFTPTNGSFVLHVTNTTTGLDTSTLVQVNLTGSPGDTTLNSLAASLNAINGVKATVNGGTLTIASTNSNSTLSFSQDSSGVLATLGINNFYTGTDATNIAVNSTLMSQPRMLAAAKNGNADDNQTALAIAALPAQPVAALNGTSLNDTYQSMINNVATQTAAATTNAQAAQAVQNTLQSQRDQLSGVSIDEETVNLLQQQQAFMGASKLISIVDTLMQTLVGMVQ